MDRSGWTVYAAALKQIQDSYTEYVILNEVKDLSELDDDPVYSKFGFALILARLNIAYFALDGSHAGLQLAHDVRDFLLCNAEGRS